MLVGKKYKINVVVGEMHLYYRGELISENEKTICLKDFKIGNVELNKNNIATVEDWVDS